MRAVLPEAEVKWLVAQRAPAVSIIGRVRKLLHDQYTSGALPAHLHFKLEQNLLELYTAHSFKPRHDLPNMELS